MLSWETSPFPHQEEDAVSHSVLWPQVLGKNEGDIGKASNANASLGKADIQKANSVLRTRSSTHSQANRLTSSRFSA